MEVRVWSGHHFEVVEARAERTLWRDVEAAANKHLNPVRSLKTSSGGLFVWHPRADAETSISRRLERHDMMWLQPLRARGGWEHYDAIAFGENEQAALDDLRRDHETQVVRRQSISPDDASAALFLSLHPLLEAPTAKQAEALVQAGALGYYESPRRVTTAMVAESLGIGRSAFEERLRSGENRVMAAFLPAMSWYRGTD